MTPDSPLDLDLSEVQLHIAPTGKVRKLLKHHSGDDYILELDWSSLESFLVCRRSTLWKLVHSRSTYATPALTYGSAVHSALEVLYRHKAQLPEIPINLGDLFAAGEEHFMRCPPPVGEYRSYEYFCTNIQKYLKMEETRGSLDPIFINGSPAVELPFAFPLGEIDINTVCPFDRAMIVENGDDQTQDFNVGLNVVGAGFWINKVHIVWTGIIDLIVQQNQKLRITDHKTSSIIGESYFKGFELSQQLRGYQWATEKLLGHEIDGAVLNVIASRKPSSKEEMFFRRYYPYPRHRIDEWPDSILTLSADILHCLTSNSFPEETNWCVGKFGTCPYHDVCSEPPENRLLLLGSDKYCDNVWNPIDV